MLNSIFSRGTFLRRGERKPLLAAGFLGALLSLCIVPGSAFGQDQPEAPPPPAAQSDQASSPSTDPGTGRRMGHRQMPSVDDQLKHLTSKLNLSDDQQAKLKPILEEQRKEMEQVHNASSLSREERFHKMQELRQSSDTQIKSVLNEDQQKNFDKMREEQRNRMNKWRKGGENTPPPGGSPDSQ